jgi:hypothetical protein
VFALVRAHQDRLHQPLLTDRSGELIKLFAVEGLAGIERARIDAVDRHHPLFAVVLQRLHGADRRIAGLLDILADQ